MPYTGDVDPTHEVTRLLDAARRGEGDALERLLPLIYDQLRTIADRQLKRERSDHTLQATALVHEVYLSLVGRRSIDVKDRSHFFAVAATAMRRVLVDHARHRQRQKRGGDRAKLQLHDDIQSPILDEQTDLVALDESLKRLESIDERKARTVELRFFAGLTVDETAEVLDVSDATVRRDWEFARAWLLKDLG